ncbi:efflux RND transporter permease subunit [Rhodohalobacter barkolensis]|uniref:AcrB/AcrD/AcrF family protein n=1 Tax=Rhodohalobacter barkolensis TaxID=2053187 RepID=A0A2N0VEL8_9BACT|nr:efflux RND transporter permease subunit [Rhodohalobacter barkolensis]PKD42633.1 AcrB/AcrD/AcrF family protein [Rhodohalobacter barkolensis]
MGITDTSIKRPIATTMVYLIVLVLGVVGFRYLPVDLLPPIEYPRLSVQTSYPNVGSEEIETIITDQIENALSGVANVEEMTSRSQEGSSWVSLNFSQNTNLDEAANDVRAALDDVRRSLPDEADNPRVRKFDPNDSPIVIVGAQSTRSLDELTLILEEEIASRLEQIPGVGSIDVWGGIRREIRVDLKRDRLAASNLTAIDVQNAIVAENNTLPGGNVRDGLTELYVRTLGEYTDVNQISETIITRVDGQPVRVRDVATVEDAFEDVGRVVRINDEPMIRMGIRKQTGANTVAVSEGIQREIERINSERNDINLLMVIDQSEFIQDSIDNVQEAAIWGALLAIVVLYLFLRNGSTTFIIATAIPVSIVATFGLLYFGGLTLNQMSFGGLALGVGLIVDNAIVVLENIVRLRSKGKSLAESSLIGTKEVGGAIIASTITTSVIFLPVVFMQTITGTLFQELALVVVFALACSLLVALTLVPMLASKFMTIKPDSELTDKDKGWFQKWFERFENRYSRFLESAIKRRYTVFAISAVLVGISFYGLSYVDTELAPETEADEISINFYLGDGMNIAVANEYLDELVAKVKEIAPMDEVEYMSTEVRNGRAEVELKLVDASERSINSYDLADDIRDQIEGTIPGGSFRVQAQTGLWILRRIFGNGGDEALQLQLRGYDMDIADELAEQIRYRMEEIPEVRDVRSDREDRRPEQNIVFDRERISALGLTGREVAQSIQANIGGVRAGVYREGGDEFDITVRLQESDRMSTLDLNNISVRTADGETVPVSTVIDQNAAEGPETINRINGQRVTYITANLEAGVPLGEAVEKVQASLSGMELPTGFSIVYGGEYEEQQKAQADFVISILMALVLIYMVMAAQFERFLDPLIVMFSVPVAVIGVVPTLLLTGTTLNMQSIMGVIMLIGIVVNNAIVLVDYINLMRRDKEMNVLKAVIESGRLRLRPILMTTLTTVLGLLPLSFGFGAGGEIQAALARVVIGGLTASTLITLVLIPVVYISANELKEYVVEKKAAFQESGKTVPATQTS